MAWENLSLAPARLLALRFSADQVGQLSTIGFHRGRQDLFLRQLPELLQAMRQRALIESAESSSRIEGVTAPRERVEAIVAGGARPANRPEAEIAGYRAGLDLVHESGTDMPFTANVMLLLHSHLFRQVEGAPHGWKRADNVILEHTADGGTRVRFRPVAANQTADAVAALVAHHAAANAAGQAPLIVAPLAILDFLCIHPFTDGNGRVSRLLTLMLLYAAGLQVGRYISLERIVEDSKERYYLALQRSSSGWHEGTHDVAPWLDYFWAMVVRAYVELEDRVGTLRAGRGAKTEMVRRAVARRFAAFGIADLERDCPGVSREMVRRVLRALRAEGKITQQGHGRGATWAPKTR